MSGGIFDTLALEWDLCYVQREADMRVARVDAHRRYLESRGYVLPQAAVVETQAAKS